MEKKPFLLAISGPTNSGKTFLRERILHKANELGLTTQFISTDDFYKDLSHLTMEERNQINYDDPKSIAGEEFQEAIGNLQLGKICSVPIYDFAEHNRTGKTRDIAHCDLIIVEGIFAYSFDEINKMYSLKIFVEVDPDIRIIRRILRDINERGRTMESVIAQHLETVKPTQALFVERDRGKADIILNGEMGEFKIVDIMLSYIKAQS